MKPRRTHLIVAILALVSALVLSACGESEGGAEGTSLSLTLDDYPNANHAGIYTAQERGYFEDAGLDITISTPSDQPTPIEQVATGRTDLAIAREPEVILAKARGEDVVAVASVVNIPLTSLIWLGSSDVDSIAELRNGAVAFTGVPFERAYLDAALADEGLTIGDVDTVEVARDYLVSTLRGRSIDAALGNYRNIEGEELRATGADPVVDPIDWVGVPTYDELVVIGRRESLEDNEDAIRNFMTALIRGTKAAKESRKATVALMRKTGPKKVVPKTKDLSPEAEERVLRAQVDDTLPMLAEEGRMGAAKWDEFIAWMHENELIEDPIPASEVLTNEYLPGEIAD